MRKNDKLNSDEALDETLMERAKKDRDKISESLNGFLFGVTTAVNFKFFGKVLKPVNGSSSIGLIDNAIRVELLEELKQAIDSGSLQNLQDFYKKWRQKIEVENAIAETKVDTVRKTILETYKIFRFTDLQESDNKETLLLAQAFKNTDEDQEISKDEEEVIGGTDRVINEDRQSEILYGEVLTKIAADIDLEPEARSVRQSLFPIKAFETLLQRSREFNLSTILSNASKNKESQSFRILSYIYDYRHANTVYDQVIHAFSSETLFAFLKKVNWYGLSGVLTKAALEKMGFSTHQDYKQALDLNDVFDALDKLCAYYRQFKVNDSINFQSLIIGLIQDRDLNSCLMKHKEAVCELINSLNIPTMEDRDVASLIEIIIEFQKKFNRIDKPVTDKFGVLERLVDERESMEDTMSLLRRLIVLAQRLHLVVRTFVQPMYVNLSELIEVDVKKLFEEAIEAISSLDKKSVYTYLYEGGLLLYDCRKRFKAYDHDGFGLMPTPKKDAIRALDMRGVVFGGHNVEQPYLLSRLYIKGFNFSQCQFNHCHFSQSVLEDCCFEGAEFKGTIDVTGLYMNQETANTFIPRLSTALDEGNVRIIGRIKLVGEFNELPISLPEEYIDGNLSTGVLFYGTQNDNSNSKSTSSQREDDASDDDQASANRAETIAQTSPVYGFFQSVGSMIPTPAISGYSYVQRLAKQSWEVASAYAEAMEAEESISPLCELGNRIEMRIAELEEKVLTLDSVSDEQGEQLNALGQTQQELRVLKDALDPLQVYWQEKQSRRQLHQQLVGEKGECVAVYYKTLLTQLNAFFQGLLVLQSDFFEKKQGQATSMSSKVKTTSSAASILSATTTVAESVVNSLLPNTGAVAKAVKTVSKTLGLGDLKLLSSKLLKLPESIPLIGIATSATKLIADEVVGVMDRRSFARANNSLLGLTPKLLGQLASKLASEVTLTYEEQVNLLTTSSAERYAECGVMRIIVCLFSGLIDPNDFVNSAIKAMQIYDVKQRQLKVEFIQWKMAIPFFHQNLRSRYKLEGPIDEDMLYRKTGLRYAQENGRLLYYSNDKKIRKGRRLFRPLEKMSGTYANLVGYIQTTVIPMQMTLDDGKRGPIILEGVNKETIGSRIIDPAESVSPPDDVLQQETARIDSSKRIDIITLEKRIAELEEEQRDTKLQLNMLWSAIGNALHKHPEDQRIMSISSADTQRQFMVSLHGELGRVYTQQQAEGKANLQQSKKPITSKGGAKTLVSEIIGQRQSSNMMSQPHQQQLADAELVQRFFNTWSNAIEQKQREAEIRDHQEREAIKAGLKQQTSRYGFDCVNVGEDGDCLFHAVIAQLVLHKIFESETLSVQQLRALAIQHVINHADLYRESLDIGINVFVDKALQQGMWADHHVILALSRALNVTLVIIRSDGTPPVIIRQSNPKGSVFLGYEAGWHYQSLVFKKNIDGKVVPELNIHSIVLNEEEDNWGKRYCVITP